MTYTKKNGCAIGHPDLATTSAAGGTPDHEATRETLAAPASLRITSLELHRAIRAKEAMHLTGDKKSHFYARLNPKSPAYDATFPRPFRLDDSARSPSVFWVHEVLTWLQNRAMTSRKSAVVLPFRAPCLKRGARSAADSNLNSEVEQ